MNYYAKPNDTVEIKDGSYYMLRNKCIVKISGWDEAYVCTKPVGEIGLIGMWHADGTACFYNDEYSEAEAEFDCVAEVFPCL
jgi:hypothetical protein